jgi:hypothetical protein
MTTPMTGQKVRLENFGDQMIVKSVNEESQTVELVRVAAAEAGVDGSSEALKNIPVAGLLPGDDLAAG